MKMGLVVVALAASMLAAPAFAGSAATSESEVSVQGASLGTGNVTANGSDTGKVTASDVFGTSNVSTSNVATGSESTHGFAEGTFDVVGITEGEAASHF